MRELLVPSELRAAHSHLYSFYYCFACVFVCLQAPTRAPRSLSNKVDKKKLSIKISYVASLAYLIIVNKEDSISKRQEPTLMCVCVFVCVYMYVYIYVTMALCQRGRYSDCLADCFSGDCQRMLGEGLLSNPNPSPRNPFGKMRVQHCLLVRLSHFYTV